jgi:hypothetical protein
MVHERFMQAQKKGANPMTRSSKLALVTLLAGLLSLASVATVDASVGSPCTGYAQEHCAQMAAADGAIVYHVEAFAAVHTLAGSGIGQEHFEAMSATQVTAFSVAIPRTVATGAETRSFNTTNLPSAVAVENAPVVTSARQRFLEANTVMLPAGPSSPYAEGATPTLGHPR